MISFELNGKQYKTPASWQQVTFEKFLNYLSDIAPKTPEVLKNIYESEDLEKAWKKLKKKDRLKCFEFMALAVGFWVELDKEEIEQSMNLQQLQKAFWTIEIDLSEMNADENFTGFSINGKEYILPAQHMEGSTVSEFAEAAQFQENFQEVENGAWLSMLDVVAVLCRPPGEKYSYDKTRHETRKKMFKKLSMDKIINVSFFLLRLNKELQNNLLIYSLRQQVQQKQRQQLKKHTAGI